jgi:hypothetical protein
LQVTAVMGAVMMLSRAYSEHEAALERTRVISEAVKTAQTELGGSYASVAVAANAAATAEEARIAVAREMQAITASQVAAIGAHLDDIDFDAAARHERALRHDVMAHVHTLGDAAPEARAIIHLGATSQDVVCNADTLVMRCLRSSRRLGGSKRSSSSGGQGGG